MGGGTGATGAGGTGSTGAGSTGAGTTGAGSTGAGGSGTGTGMGSSMNDLPQIQATSIKMVSATCPAQ
jgi:hypothetical protein